MVAGRRLSEENLVKFVLCSYVILSEDVWIVVSICNNPKKKREQTGMLKFKILRIMTKKFREGCHLLEQLSGRPSGNIRQTEKIRIIGPLG